MKNLLFASIGVLFFVVLSSCCKENITGSGSISNETRQLDQFTGVRLNGSTDVTIVKGNGFSVAVEGYQNLLPYFETKVVNGTLNLGYKTHANIRHSNLRATVTMPSFSNINLNGSGNITTNGNFTGLNNVEVEISGSGNIKLQEGDAKNFSSRISGSGDVHAFNFIAEKAKVNLSGSGTTRITANDVLDVKISGSGSVYYKGSPTVNSSISGSGRVIKQ